MNADQHWQNLSPHSLQQAGVAFVLLSLSKVLSGKFPPTSLTPSLSRANAETCFKWNSPQVKGISVSACRVTVWNALGKEMSVQQQWRESRERLSIFTEQRCFSIWCFSALPLFRARPCNSFVLIPVHCQARNPVSGSDLCWQGWGRSWKPFSPCVLATHPRGEINSLWKHLHPTERSPESWGRCINGGSSRLCSNMGGTSSSKNIAKKFLTVAISEELEVGRWCSGLSFFTQCNTVQSLLWEYFLNSFVCIKCLSPCGLWPVWHADWGCRICPCHLLFCRQSAVFWIHMELWVWARFCFSYFMPTLSP